MRRRPDPPDHEDDDERGPSKSHVKREMEALQDMGAAMLELPDDQFAAVQMPERLRDAFNDYRRFPTLEAKRRQMQFIGKLLRSADPEPLRQALEAHRRNKARDALTLHEAEMWRERLLTGDEGWQAWCEAFPDSNNRALRGLVANALREQEQAADVARRTGDAPRKGKLYRELFQKVRAALLQRNSDTRESG
jgi:ribosome-associated protein